MMLKTIRWSRGLAFSDRPERWTATEHDAYGKWLAERGIAEPAYLTEMRPTSPPERTASEPLRKYRRRIRRFWIDYYGSVGKKRAAEKKRRETERDYLLASHAGERLMTPNAVRYFLRQIAIKELKRGAVKGWHRYSSEVQSALSTSIGVTFPIGVDAESILAALVDPMLSRRRTRREINKHLYKPDIKTRLAEVRSDDYIFSFIHKAQFKITLRRNGLRAVPAHSKSWEASIGITVSRPHSRGHQLELHLRPDWWKKVGIRRYANLFGPRTFVLDVEHIGRDMARFHYIEQEVSERCYVQRTVIVLLDSDTPRPDYSTMRTVKEYPYGGS